MIIGLAFLGLTVVIILGAIVTKNVAARERRQRSEMREELRRKHGG